MARRWKMKKKRSRPVKSTSTYKKGMKKTALLSGAVGILFVAMFYKLPIIQTLVSNTWTYEGNK